MTEPSDNGVAPPSFADARTRRQKVRAAGLSPDYWYPVEYDRAVKRGQAVEVRFGDSSIALYRGQDGRLHALENRCAHRQLKLSLGVVEDCRLTCAYHGWSYAGDGQLAHVAHDLFGKPLVKVRVHSYPVQVRYGLVWLFPGDPALAQQRKVPDIAELEGPNRWACVPLDFTWRAHHSMIIDNVSDFTHAYLHRRYRPFVDPRLVHREAQDDRVRLMYESQIGRGRISGLFVDRKCVDTNSIELCYEYPYQWSNTGDKIKHWCFVLPMGQRLTRVFFLFYFESFKVPLLPLHLPRWLMTPFLHLANRWLIRPLLSEDGFAVEAEQEGYDAHPDAPMLELNPVIAMFQDLTIRKWQEHLGQRAPAADTRTLAAAEEHTG
jgi:phenylpropionate dioxygenase-like ring-hydroxylating dioxygenase large terminal subunit